MIERTLVKIYAEALFQIAEERLIVEEVYEDLKQLKWLFEESRELSNFLTSPKVDRKDKKLLLKKTLSDSLSPLTFHFLLTLVDKSREIIIPHLAVEIMEILDRIHNRIDVDITSAVPLEDHIKGKLNDTLSRVLNKEVMLHPRTDPTILGGIIVKVEDRIMDGSLLGELERLRAHLLDTERRSVGVNEDSA